MELFEELLEWYALELLEVRPPNEVVRLTIQNIIHTIA